MIVPKPPGPGLPLKDLILLAHMIFERDVQLDRCNRRPLVLVIISGGGFSFEIKCLLLRIGSDMDLIYLRTEYGGMPGENGFPPGESHIVPAFASMTRKSFLQSATAFLGTFKTTFQLLRRHPVDAIICSGGSHAVPMCMAGRLLGRDTIYLESVTRVDRLSITGLIIYRFRLAKMFFVQWPELHKAYPSSTLGTIL